MTSYFLDITVQTYAFEQPAKPASKRLRRFPLLTDGIAQDIPHLIFCPAASRKPAVYCVAKLFFTTMPPFITKRTLSISETSTSGLPATAMISAYLPFSMLPIWLSQS